MHLPARSRPRPPYSSGMVIPNRPSSRALTIRTSGTASFSSIQRERGSISFSAKRRISSRKRSTSGASFISAHSREHVLHPPHHALEVAALHHLHHLLHLLELVQEAVHLLHRDAGTGRDAALARGLDDVGMGALLSRHRVDDALDAAELGVVLELRRRQLSDELGGQLVHERGDAAHLLHLLDLLLEILEVEILALPQLLRDALSLLDVDLLVRL